MKLIYFDAGNPQKKKELEQLAKSAGYDFVPVTAMQTGQKIGYLAVFPDIGKHLCPCYPCRRESERICFYLRRRRQIRSTGAGVVKKRIGF